MPDMREGDWVEQRLADAGAAMVYPATPDFAGSLGWAAGVTTAPPVARLRPMLRLGLVAALVVVLVGGAALATLSSVRDTVADFLGLAVEGERIEHLPTPAPGVTPTPFPTPQDIAAIATPATIDDLRRRLGREPALIPGRGTPQAMYTIDYNGIPSVVLDYGDLTLWETVGGVFEKFVFVKGATQGSVQETRVKGQPAYWIAGGGHIVRFLGADGKEVVGSQRTVLGATLVWHGATLGYRMETDLSMAEAIAIAEGLP